MGANLVRDHLPHAPGLGLWVAPDIPPAKLSGALEDYARGVSPEDVLALYDGTVFGSAKDGAVFLADRLVTQSSDLEAPRTIRYGEVVGVRERRAGVGGRRVDVEVARGRTTVTERIDFSAHGGAAAHVARLLEAALLLPPAPPAGTDRTAVAAALDGLVAAGRLTADERARMLAALAGGIP